VKEEKNETKKGIIVFLVFGGIFLSLAAVFMHFGLWPGIGYYAIGLMMMSVGLSYLKCKIYANYIITALLFSGATIAVLGWFLLPPLTTFWMFIAWTGVGIFSGGFARLMINLVVKPE